MASRKDFLRILGFTLVCFVAANQMMAVWSHRLPIRKKLDAVSTASDANVLLLGNSLLDGRIDNPAFERAARQEAVSLVPVNAALGASMPPEQYLLFVQGIQRPQIRQVVIGFYDFQLTSPTPTKVSDLVGNRALAFDSRIAGDDAESIYHFDFADRVKYRVFRAFPLFAYRSSAWKYVELLRRKLGEVGVPHAKTNSQGRVADFRALEQDSPEAFDRKAEEFAAHPSALNEPMTRIILQAQARDCEVVLFLMPASPFHRAAFYSRPSWDRYVQALKTLAAQRGVRFIDASHWFTDQSDFADDLHLEVARRSAFSERMAHAVAKELPLLPAVSSGTAANPQRVHPDAFRSPETTEAELALRLNVAGW